MWTCRGPSPTTHDAPTCPDYKYVCGQRLTVAQTGCPYYLYVSLDLDISQDGGARKTAYSTGNSYHAIESICTAILHMHALLGLAPWVTPKKRGKASDKTCRRRTRKVGEHIGIINFSSKLAGCTRDRRRPRRPVTVAVRGGRSINTRASSHPGHRFSLVRTATEPGTVCGSHGLPSSQESKLRDISGIELRGLALSLRHRTTNECTRFNICLRIVHPSTAQLPQ